MKKRLLHDLNAQTAELLVRCNLDEIVHTTAQGSVTMIMFAIAKPYLSKSVQTMIFSRF